MSARPARRGGQSLNGVTIMTRIAPKSQWSFGFAFTEPNGLTDLPLSRLAWADLKLRVPAGHLTVTQAPWASVQLRIPRTIINRRACKCIICCIQHRHCVTGKSSLTTRSSLI